MNHLRNLCIIAHVDHGKTTLVDHLLKQAGTFEQHEEVSDRVMDSMDLERERGITISAKNTSIRLGDVKANIVDTPGHADFGGEVERILGMVDGAVLLVDAAEGPLPQTRFVLKKAIENHLKLVLVINKVDRPDCRDGKRIQEVVDQTFDLFVELKASDDQLDFPIVYACAREGWCTTNYEEIDDLIEKKKEGSLKPLFDLILNVLPAPKVAEGQDLKVLISNLGYSEYVGSLAIGRILSGSVKRNQRIYRHGVDASGKPIVESFSATRLYHYEGLKQVETQELQAGEIGIFAGTENFVIGDTLVSDQSIPPLKRIEVEPPTVSMIFSINSSPLSGKEGEPLQSRKLRERLLREIRNNVALKLDESSSGGDQFRMLGRGELQFAILIEQMRREGSEFMVGKPLVLFNTDEATGERLEPVEKVYLDLPEENVGDVTSLFQQRKGVMLKYEATDHDETQSTKKRVQLEFEIPTRGLLGMRSKYLTLTRGAGILSSELLGFQPFKGQIMHRLNGAMVSDRNGSAIEYALLTLEDRGILFVKPGDPVYEGMVIGECNLENDLNVNPCREKKLTNMRAANAEVLVTLKGTREMSLEQCIEWIDEDEWIEITPESVRIRKKVLAMNHRSVKRAERLGI